MRLTVPLVLASASPRRLHLLKAMGLDPVVHPADVDERMVGEETAQGMTKRLALAKAGAVAPSRPNSLVLGSDTVVVIDGAILGKPDSPEEAARMLKTLSGRTHQVMTSVGLIHNATDRSVVGLGVTDVTFDKLTDTQISRYVDSGAPLDKAGSYGIQDDQGAFFVNHIRGDYYTVVGLPLNLLYRLVVSSFPDLLSS